MRGGLDPKQAQFLRALMNAQKCTPCAVCKVNTGAHHVVRVDCEHTIPRVFASYSRPSVCVLNPSFRPISSHHQRSGLTTGAAHSHQLEPLDVVKRRKERLEMSVVAQD